jgi:GT2 family glycosyltransferase
MTVKLSVVIVSYNTKKLLEGCIKSVLSHRDEVSLEVIVVDNNSRDGSAEMVEKKYPKAKLVVNSENLGFAKANNLARNIAKGEFILFLNSDTVVHRETLKNTVKYLEENRDVGSVTCKAVLPSGKLDKDVRRSFPTPWVSFTHIFLRLDRLFPRSETFSKYWYGYINEDETHDVDVVQGAFHLTRKKILDEVGWFDEDYFLDGEDIDLCWRIKKAGWRIVYYPLVKITHYKKASKKNPKTSSERKRFKSAGVDAMEIFYRKRLWGEYPLLINYVVLVGIKIFRAVRYAAAHL